MLLMLAVVWFAVVTCLQGLALAIELIRWGIAHPFWILGSVPVASLLCWIEYLWIVRFYPIPQ